MSRDCLVNYNRSPLSARLTPQTTLFPYTTLFRSELRGERGKLAVEEERASGALRLLEEQVRAELGAQDRKSTRLNSSHGYNSYAVFCLKRKKPPHTKSPQRLMRRLTG